MKRIILFLVIFLGIRAVTAQDNRSNLLDMLNAVPDLLENRDSLISYVDFRAMETAREGAAIYDSWDEFATSDQSLEAGLYMAALRGLSSGPSFLSNIFAGGELWEETIGFDFFDIDSALYFGTPPAHGDVLMGDFDMNAVKSAFIERNFTVDTLGNFDLWCGEVGCDNGMMVDLQNRNLGDPFGGDLGRQQPLLISDDMAISSSALPILILAEDAVTDKLDSLADNPTYISAVNSINPDNTLIQASFVYFTQIVPNIPFDITDSDVDIEDAQQEMSALRDMPQYELVLFADTATDAEQVVYVTLVYSALEDAETAIEIIPERLATMDSFRADRPFQDIFDDRGVSEITASAVFDEAADRAVAIFEIHAPLASSDEEDRDELGFVASSMVYRLFIDMVYSRDTDWLVGGMGDS